MMMFRLVLFWVISIFVAGVFANCLVHHLLAQPAPPHAPPTPPARATTVIPLPLVSPLADP